eukprot:gene3497-2448_t
MGNPCSHISNVARVCTTNLSVQLSIHPTQSKSTYITRKTQHNKIQVSRVTHLPTQLLSKPLPTITNYSTPRNQHHSNYLKVSLGVNHNLTTRTSYTTNPKVRNVVSTCKFHLPPTKHETLKLAIHRHCTRCTTVKILQHTNSHNHSAQAPTQSRKLIDQLRRNRKLPNKTYIFTRNQQVTQTLTNLVIIVNYRNTGIANPNMQSIYHVNYTTHKLTHGTQNPISTPTQNQLNNPNVTQLQSPFPTGMHSIQPNKPQQLYKTNQPRLALSNPSTQAIHNANITNPCLQINTKYKVAVKVLIAHVKLANYTSALLQVVQTSTQTLMRIKGISTKKNQNPQLHPTSYYLRDSHKTFKGARNLKYIRHSQSVSWRHLASTDNTSRHRKLTITQVPANETTLMQLPPTVQESQSIQHASKLLNNLNLNKVKQHSATNTYSYNTFNTKCYHCHPPTKSNPIPHCITTSVSANTKSNNTTTLCNHNALPNFHYGCNALSSNHKRNHHSIATTNLHHKATINIWPKRLHTTIKPAKSHTTQFHRTCSACLNQIYSAIAAQLALNHIPKVPVPKNQIKPVLPTQNITTLPSKISYKIPTNKKRNYPANTKLTNLHFSALWETTKFMEIPPTYTISAKPLSSRGNSAYQRIPSGNPGLLSIKPSHPTNEKQTPPTYHDQPGLPSPIAPNIRNPQLVPPYATHKQLQTCTTLIRDLTPSYIISTSTKPPTRSFPRNSHTKPIIPRLPATTTIPAHKHTKVPLHIPSPESNDKITSHTLATMVVHAQTQNTNCTGPKTVYGYQPVKAAHMRFPQQKIAPRVHPKSNSCRTKMQSLHTYEPGQKHHKCTKSQNNVNNKLPVSTNLPYTPKPKILTVQDPKLCMAINRKVARMRPATKRSHHACTQNPTPVALKCKACTPYEPGQKHHKCTKSQNNVNNKLPVSTNLPVPRPQESHHPTQTQGIKHIPQSSLKAPTNIPNVHLQNPPPRGKRLNPRHALTLTIAHVQPQKANYTALQKPQYHRNPLLSRVRLSTTVKHHTRNPPAKKDPTTCAPKTRILAIRMQTTAHAHHEAAQKRRNYAKSQNNVKHQTTGAKRAQPGIPASGKMHATPHNYRTTNNTPHNNPSS